jgi:nucleosome assembly protein 1-like 1
MYVAYIHSPCVDYQGFRLDFVFEENEFFGAATLTKTYFLTNSPNLSYGDIMFDHAEGCDIAWKEGKDVTVRIETKKQRHKGTNKTRVVKKVVKADSFFNFFKPPKVPTEEEEQSDDEEDFEMLEQAVQEDYEIGEVIKEKIVEDAVNWFTGKALEYEEGLFDEDDEEEEDEFDDLGEDDDDDGEHAGAPPANAQAPECKQQ